MEPWILATLAAAAVQTLRFMLQRQLKAAGLSTAGATFARFVWAAPLALAVALLLTGGALPGTVPGPGPAFWLWAAAGGLGQILATAATVALFSLRNFAVGIAFTKTETVQVAAFSALLLAEPVPPAALAAILAGFLGVLLLSRGTELRFDARATALGLVAGGLFGLSAIGYRAAALELGAAPATLRAAVTLAAVTALQVAMMAAWLRLRQPGEIGRVLRAWRRTLPVGVTGVVGSYGWFVAFALQNAALVRAVGQVEIVFTLAVSALVFRERLRWREGLGIALVVGSLVALVLALR